MRHNRIFPWTNITTEDTRPVWHTCKVTETQGAMSEQAMFNDNPQ